MTASVYPTSRLYQAATIGITKNIMVKESTSHKTVGPHGILRICILHQKIICTASWLCNTDMSEEASPKPRRPLCPTDLWDPSEDELVWKSTPQQYKPEYKPLHLHWVKLDFRLCFQDLQSPTSIFLFFFALRDLWAWERDAWTTSEASDWSLVRARALGSYRSSWIKRVPWADHSVTEPRTFHTDMP